MEKELFCLVKDFPEWAQRAIRERWGPRKRPRCSIVATETVHVHASAHAGAGQEYVVWNSKGQVEKIDTDWGTGFVILGQRRLRGGPVKLLEDWMVLKTEEFSDGATLYVHPSNLRLLLPAPPELSDLERKALCIIDHFIPAARLEPFAAWGINEETFALLRQKGLVTKRGAITVEGRNAVEDISYEQQQEFVNPPFELRWKC